MEPVSEGRVYSNRYQVTHLIARGGMALVYRAQDLLLGRAVALKVLYPELSADPTFVERFRREAQAAANLSHPNIVPVFDWGQDEGTYFIVMELIEGTSLAEMVRAQRTISPSRAASITASVASALGYAHRSGVVHRDVKPGNILITPDGQVKVTDFGIAQAVASEDHLAEAGSVMGTATYFSPEQAEGSPVDGRSDVYSLGVVLYELLVGRPPFVGDSPVAVSSQHVHGVVPPPSEFGAVPSDLEAIVLTALAKSPAQRYQTADELRADLVRFTEGQPVRAATRERDYFTEDATRAVQTVAPADRTQAVPVMTGPRTDVRRRGGRTAAWLVPLLVIIVAAAGALAYVQMHKTPSATTMPNVVGQTVANATATLQSDGLSIGTTKLVNSNQPSGTVVGTDPKAGASVKKTQSVTLQVSQGPAGSPVTVPDTTGQQLSVAESTLQQLGLVPKVVFTQSAPSGGATPNSVISQNPVGGSSSRTGRTVVLTVLAPNSSFALPNVRGQTQLQAAATLGQYGLTVSSSSQTSCSNTVNQGSVLRTVPAAGASVQAGASIQLVTSSGYCNVVVPSIIGSTTVDAQGTLSGQGLSLGIVTDAPPDACTAPNSSGTIVTQNPGPGASALYNSSVDVTVCP